MKTKTHKIPIELPKTQNKLNYCVEFFHIYSDEKIKTSHNKGVEYLQTIQKVWGIKPSLVILIDDYNPSKNTLKVNNVASYLEKQGIKPDFWAYETDFIIPAQQLLKDITNKKTLKNYESYIKSHKKMPCSLLTASWYLSRLGALDGGDAFKSFNKGAHFKPADRLINILQSEYKPVELRAMKIIKDSIYSHYADRIQDLFYPAASHKKLDLF